MEKVLFRIRNHHNNQHLLFTKLPLNIWMLNRVVDPVPVPVVKRCLDLIDQFEQGLSPDFTTDGKYEFKMYVVDEPSGILCTPTEWRLLQQQRAAETQVIPPPHVDHEIGGEA